MADFGVKVSLQVEVNKSDLRNQIQQAVSSATEKNKIVLKNIRVQGDAISSALRSSINDATKKNPLSIKVSSVQIPSKALSDLQKSIKDSNIVVPVKSIDATQAVTKLRSQLTKMLSGLQIGGLKDFLGDTARSDALKGATEAAEKQAAALTKANEQATQYKANLQMLNALSTGLRSVGTSIFGITDASAISTVTKEYIDLQNQVNNAKANVEKLSNAEVEALYKSVAALKQKVSTHKELSAASSKASKASADSAKAEEATNRKLVSLDNKRIALYSRIYQWTQKNTKAYQVNKKAVDDWLSTLNSGGIDEKQLSNINSSFLQLDTTVKKAGLSGRTFFQVFQQGMEKFGGWAIVTRSMMAAYRMVRDMITAVIDLDSAMTELRRVTDETEAGYQRFASSAASTARRIGATIADTVNATADFARLGYNIDDAAQLAEAALIYKNIGDGIEDISQATESIISTMRAFGYEASEAMGIVDEFNNIGNKFAITSAGIGEAMTRSASALFAAGNTLEESIGMITAMNSVVQNPQSVGTALKTLTMYLRAAKTEAEDAGIETDGMADSVSKLRKEISSLTGVDIMLDDKTFKSTFQIIKEISKVWTDLSDVSRANVLNLLGGKRNANVLSALITNFGEAEAAATEALNSIGSAAAENATYLDSIAGKIAVMKASFEEMSNAIVSSNLVKFIIDIATAIMNVATALQKVGFLVPVIVTAATTIKSIKDYNAVSDLVRQFDKLSSGADGVKGALDSISGAANQMSSSQQKMLSHLLNTTKGVNAAQLSEAGLAVSGRTAALSQNALSGSMSATAKAGMSLKSALAFVNVGILAVSLAVSGITYLIRKHNEAVDESISKAKEITDSYNSQIQTYQNNISTLNSLKERFDILSDGVDKNGKNVSLTAKEYDEYLSIVKQIVSISPSVSSGFDSEKGSMGEYRDMISSAIEEQEKFIENEKRIKLGNTEDLFNGQLNAYEKAIDDAIEAGQEITSALDDALYGYGISDKITDVWSDIYKELGLDSVDGLMSGLLSFDKDVTYQATKVVYENQSVFLKALNDSVKKALIESGKYTREESANIAYSIMRSVNTPIYGLTKPFRDMNDALTPLVDQLMLFADVGGVGFEWYSDDIGDGAIAALRELAKEILLIDQDAERSKALFSTYGKELAGIFSDKAFLGIVGMSEKIDGSAESIEAYYNTVSDYLDGLSDKGEHSSIISSILEQYLYGLAGGIRSVSESSEESNRSLNDLSESLERFQKGFNILKSAQSEMAESGGISVDTFESIQKLLGEEEKITDFIYAENGMLKLNEDAWRERYEAMTGNDISFLEDEISEMEKYIDLARRGIESGLDFSDKSIVAMPSAEDILKSWRSNRLKIPIDVEVAPNSGFTEDDIEWLKSNDLEAYVDQYEEYVAQLELLYALIGEISGKDDPLDNTATISKLNETADAFKSFYDYLDRVSNGAKLSYNDIFEIVQKFPDHPELMNLFNAESAEDQIKILSGVADQYKEVWTEIINERILALESAKDGLDPLSEEAVAIDAVIKQWESFRDNLTIEGLAFIEDQADANKLLADSYNNVKAAIESIPSTSDVSQITYQEYQKLIEQDKRYAAAVEYQNGVLTLNRDAYNAVTNEIIRSTQQQALAAAQTIIASDEYKDLTSRIGELSDAEQERLDNLNAEIMGYAVLTNELENAQSAYQRFIRASDSTSSDRYSAAEKALKVIEDTLHNQDSDIFGKIGREQYRAAIDFLIDPNIEVGTDEFDKALETIHRYLDNGAEGINNFVEDLIQNGFVNESGYLKADLDEIAKSLGLSMEGLRSIIDEYNQYQDEDHQLKVEAAVDTTGVDEGVQSAEEQLASLQSQVSDLNSTLDIDHSITVDTDSATTNIGKITTGLSDAINKLNTLNGKTATTRVHTIYSSSGGVSGASGIDAAPGGRTLVGELGMETVVDPNTNSWYTVGHGGAEFVNLPKGAIVFNASQTKKLFEMGRIGSRGQAMASGTVDSGGSIKKSTGLGSIISGVTGMFSNALNSLAGSIKDTAKDVVSGGVKTVAASSKSSSSSKGGSTQSQAKDLEKLKEQYEAINDEIEHLIKHQEHLYKVAENGLDFPGMKDSLTEQARLYRQIMDNAQQAVRDMIAAGATDTDKELQAMEEVYWSAYDSLYNTFDKINALHVDALNDKIDGIQNAYSNLSDALKEYQENGSITTDTFQELIKNGIQYLSFLDKVDGQYVVNEDSINRLIAAEKEQLAVEEALSYIERLKIALQDGSSEAVANLVNLTNDISNSTWDHVYANAALLQSLGLTNEQYEQVLFNIEALRSMSAATIKDPIGGIADSAEQAKASINDLYEHLIEHQKHLYNVAENGMDFNGMRNSLSEQARLYQMIMSEASERVKEMIENGIEDTDKELQSMEQTYWSAYNNLYSTLDQINALYVDALNSKIDSIQNSYKNLSDAIDEFNETGSISVDAFQELISHGVQYLNCLDKVNGQYVLNQDAVNRMIEAEKEQLAIEQAISYIQQIKTALSNQDAEALANLVNLTNEVSASTWEQVYANAALLKTMGISDDQYQNIIHNIDMLHDLSKNVRSDVGNMSGAIADAYKSQEDALDKILDYTQELIKYETKQHIKAIEDEIDAYKKIIDLKKESLRASKEEASYANNVAEKTKDIAKIQARIDQLSLDDSREARAERAALQEELADLQADLGSIQSDHAYNAQVDALEAAAKAYEESRQKEIDAYENSISSAELLYQAALQRLNEGWDTIYQELIDWNVKAGNSLNSEITENWNLAYEAAKRYGSYVQAIVAMTGNPMNQSYGFSYGQYGLTQSAATPYFHSGGVVGGSTLKDDEVAAILQDGETVLTSRQKNGLYKIVDFAKELSHRLGTTIGKIALPAVQRDVALAGFGTMQTKQTTSNDAVVYSPTINVDISHNGAFSDADAKDYGKRIANTALGELKTAFDKRGINGIFGSRLKQ